MLRYTAQANYGLASGNFEVDVTDGEIRYPGDPADERINVPAIARHYWRYRMHISLEELLADEAFCDHIRSLVRDAARGI